MKPGFETYWLIWFEGLSAGCERSPKISERKNKTASRGGLSEIRLGALIRRQGQRGALLCAAKSKEAETGDRYEHQPS